MYNYLVHSNLVKWHYGSFSADVSLFGDRWGTEKTIYGGTSTPGSRINQRGIVSTGSTVHWFDSFHGIHNIPGRYHRVNYTIRSLLFFEYSLRESFTSWFSLLSFRFWMYPIVSKGHHEESCNWGIGQRTSKLHFHQQPYHFWTHKQSKTFVFA